MSSTGYFKKISRVMEIEAPPAIVITPLRHLCVQFARMTSEKTDHGHLSTPVDDAFLLTLALNTLPEHNIWLGGHHSKKGATRVGQSSIVDLRVDTVVEMNMSFDSIQMLFPRSALTAVSEEHGGGEIGGLSIEGLLKSNDDSVIQSLGHALLPAFERPRETNPLFVDHVALAILTYLTETYGGLGKTQLVRGGLAPWQVSRAKDLLSSRMSGEISLEELARDCGVSRSHFARAFKKSVGSAPHRWLLEHRLRRARELMMSSKLSLSEIADICGFADQSHFSRCFSSKTGMPPGQWRRTHASDLEGS